MPEPDPNMPRIEPYDDVLFDKVLRMRDFEMMLHKNPGWLLAVMESGAATDEASQEAQQHISYLTGDGAEDYVFDDATEKAIAANPRIKVLLDSRSAIRDPGERQSVRDSIRLKRLLLFVERVVEFQKNQDGTGNVTPITDRPPVGEPARGGNARGNVA